MDNYLMDRETLEKFIDELIKNKPAPVNSADELYAWKEQKMQELDERLGVAIFDGLNEDQLIEINQMLDGDKVSPDAFQKFFQNAGVDTGRIMYDTLQAFSAEYFGGQNE